MRALILLDPLRRAIGHAQRVAMAEQHPMGPPPRRNRRRYPYKGTIDFQGLKIRVENPAGDVRRGVSEDGKPWATTMLVHYGEFVASEGADGDPVDAFVGPAQDSDRVYVVHQQDPQSRAYDEDKVLLGFRTKAEALAVYRAHYDRSGFVQGVRRMTVDELRTWLRDRSNRGQRMDGGRELRRGLSRVLSLARTR